MLLMNSAVESFTMICFLLFPGDQYCGGRLDKPSGSFKTPNWPEKDYPAGVTCSWHIVAPKNQVRDCQMDFIHFNNIGMQNAEFDSKTSICLKTAFVQ